MIFNGMIKAEAIFFRPENDKDVLHFVDMERDCEDGTFRVGVCCDDEWEWKFYDNASNYELVKHAIFDVVLDSGDIDELINSLDEVFEEYFYEIVAHKCCGCCEDCNCK